MHPKQSAIEKTEDELRNYFDFLLFLSVLSDDDQLQRAEDFVVVIRRGALERREKNTPKTPPLLNLIKYLQWPVYMYCNRYEVNGHVHGTLTKTVCLQYSDWHTS